MSKRTPVRELIHRIEEDIRDRRGLRQAFEAIDKDILAGVRRAWQNIIEQWLKEQQK